MTAVLVILIILILPVIYHWLCPLKAPRLDHYFQPGQSFTSKTEGVTQTIIRQVGDKVYSKVTIAPGAVGPPEHLHLGFDESVSVSKGTLTIKLNGQETEVPVGCRINFPQGQYHKFSNRTNEEVVIASDRESDFIPATFAYALAQFYPLLDSSSKLKMLHFVFKMSLFGDLFDSYIVDVPIKNQKAIKNILRPYARVLGYQLYDEKSRP